MNYSSELSLDIAMPCQHGTLAQVAHVHIFPLFQQVDPAETDRTLDPKRSRPNCKAFTGKNIINYIKAQRLAWFGHVHLMPDNSMVKKVYEWSPALARSLGRPRNRWEDDVKSDITNMKITNWRDCSRNRPKWKEFVEKAKTSLKL